MTPAEYAALEAEAVRFARTNTPGFFTSAKGALGSMVGGAGRGLEDLGVEQLGKLLHEYGKDVVERNPGSVHDPLSALSWQGVEESLGQAAGQIPASVAGGLAGRAAGGALGGAAFGPVGALVGGMAGAFLPGLAMEYGETRNIQDQSGIDDPLRALAAAAPAAALDVLTGPEALIFKNLAKYGVKEGLAKAATSGVREEEGWKGVLKHLGKQGAIGALVEGPLTEVPQTFLERLGGGASLTDDKAINDYIVSGIMGAYPGAILGGGMHAFDPTRAEINERERLAREAELKAKREASRALDTAYGTVLENAREDARGMLERRREEVAAEEAKRMDEADKAFVARRDAAQSEVEDVLARMEELRVKRAREEAPFDPNFASFMQDIAAIEALNRGKQEELPLSGGGGMASPVRPHLLPEQEPVFENLSGGLDLRTNDALQNAVNSAAAAVAQKYGVTDPDTVEKLHQLATQIITDPKAERLVTTTPFNIKQVERDMRQALNAAWQRQSSPRVQPGGVMQLLQIANDLERQRVQAQQNAPLVAEDAQRAKAQAVQSQREAQVDEAFNATEPEGQTVQSVSRKLRKLGYPALQGAEKELVQRRIDAAVAFAQDHVGIAPREATKGRQFGGTELFKLGEQNVLPEGEDPQVQKRAAFREIYDAYGRMKSTGELARVGKLIKAAAEKFTPEEIARFKQEIADEFDARINKGAQGYFDLGEGEQRNETQGQEGTATTQTKEQVNEKVQGQAPTEEVTQNAVQEQSANGEVLREQGQEVGLQEVGERDAQPEQAPAESQTEEKVVPEETVEEPTEVESPALDLSKPEWGTEVEVSALNPKTGNMGYEKMEAREAISDLDKDIAALRDFIRCVKGD